MDQDVCTMAKLVRGGVNVNAINSGGYTPLGIASERGKTVAVNWLVSPDGHNLFADSFLDGETMTGIRTAHATLIISSSMLPRP
jgi:hypothetical protein